MWSFFHKAIVLASLSPQMKLKWPRPFGPTNPQSAAVGHRRCEGHLSVGSEKLLKAMSFFFSPHNLILDNSTQI